MSIGYFMYFPINQNNFDLVEFLEDYNFPWRIFLIDCELMKRNTEVKVIYKIGYNQNWQNNFRKGLMKKEMCVAVGFLSQVVNVYNSYCWHENT